MNPAPVQGALILYIAVRAVPLQAAPTRTDPVPEIALAVSLLGVAALLELETGSLGGSSPCEAVEAAAPPPERARDPVFSGSGLAGDTVCDSSEVPAFDRWSIGASSETADVLSDALLWSVVASPFAASAIDAALGEPENRERAFFDDTLVSLEAIAATALLTAAIKVAVRRPRPLTYDPTMSKLERFEGDARLSFPSGHASLSFAAATVLALTLFEAHTGLVARAPAILVHGAAATVAALRIAAGKHFLSDVLAGASLGVAVGLVVARLHEADELPDRMPVGQTGALGPRHDGLRTRALVLGGRW